MTQFQGGRTLVLLAGMALLCGAALAQGGPRHQIVLADGAEPGGRAHGGAGARGSVQLLGGGAALIRVASLALLVGRAVPAGMAPPDLLLLPAGEAPPELKQLPPGAAQLAARDEPPSGAAVALPVGAAIARANAAPAISGAEVALAALPASAPYGRRYPLQSWEALHLSKGRLRLRLTAMPDPRGGAAPGGFLLDLMRGGASYRIYVSAPVADADRDAIARRLPGADMVLLQREGVARLALVRRRGDGAPWLEPLAGSRSAFALFRR